MLSRVEELVCICRPELALDAEMILAVFGFHNVTVKPSEFCPKDRVYFINPSQMVFEPVNWSWE